MLAWVKDSGAWPELKGKCINVTRDKTIYDGDRSLDFFWYRPPVGEYAVYFRKQLSFLNKKENA